jgi:dipeptidyl aminopeptidase/acylaminoacyl peptidase
VWLSPIGAGLSPVLVWGGPGGHEHVLDLAWSPDGRRLLVASAEELPSGAQRNRVWLLELAPPGQAASPAAARALVSLPSALVAGSFVWSPDARRVAFLARVAGRRALCLLDVDAGAFRSLADLDAADSAGARLAFPPVAWSADGHTLLFVAEAHDLPRGLFGWPEGPRRIVFRVGDDLVARPIGPTDADQVAWREDASSLLLLGRLKDGGPLVLRSADAALSQTTQLLELPVRPPAYAVRWDLGRARLLLVSPSAGASDWPEYTLVRLGLAEEED